MMVCRVNTCSVHDLLVGKIRLKLQRNVKKKTACPYAVAKLKDSQTSL